METIVEWIVAHASIAHFVFFGLLMLAGLCLPISEDLVVISAATLASTTLPENTWLLFISVFLGSYLSDWEAYAIGRFGGGRLIATPWFARHVSQRRIDQLSNFYARYGFWTLIFGRFIPFGVRNALFITAGLGRMPFAWFCLADGIACLLSNAILFSAAYWLGSHSDQLFALLKSINVALFAAAGVVAAIGIIWYKAKHKREKPQ